MKLVSTRVSERARFDSLGRNQSTKLFVVPRTELNTDMTLPLDARRNERRPQVSHVSPYQPVSLMD